MSGAYASEINSAANKYGISPALIKAVATQESSLGQTSRNIMQVSGMDGASPSAIIDKGASMLASYLKQTGSVEWALAMYNMGPGIYSWAKSNGISNPRDAMVKFSAYMRSHGYPGGYGDPYYIDHVLRYLG